MSKPIEPGCMCIVVNPYGKKRHDGKIVTIVEFIGRVRGLADTDQWRIKEKLEIFNARHINTYGRYCDWMPESMLRRIDDPELSTWDEIAKLGFVPREVA